jgi:two-component system, cell cycle response regulator
MQANSIQSPAQTKTKVLLIDDDEVEYHLVNELLNERKFHFELEWRETLKQGMERLAQGHVDVVLLDLFLGDSKGLDTFKRVKEQFKDIPIVILSGLDDEQSAVDAIQQGAQDFLVKDHVTGTRLSRVIQFAMKRHEVQNDPKNIGLIDNFSGLYNKPGFLTIADQYIKTAQRTKKGFFICFAILNDLAQIKEIYGETEANHAILTTSEIIRESFRSSDLMARMGPDEFAILTTEQDNYTPKVLSSRIKKNQKYYNAQFNRYRLSLSMCAIYFEPTESLSVNDVAEKAEHVFSNYNAKKNMDQFFVTN